MRSLLFVGSLKSTPRMLDFASSATTRRRSFLLLQSRCTRFRFAPLSRDQIEGRLVEVAKAENCVTTPDGIDAILRLSGGDMRRVLNLLQSTAMSSDVVDEKSVYLTSGAPLPQDMKTILDLLLNHSFQAAYEQIVDNVLHQRICAGRRVAGFDSHDYCLGLSWRCSCGNLGWHE